MKRYHPRWRRWICLAISLLVAILWPVAARSARPVAPRQPIAIQVQYGDTLWTLAREHGDPAQDVRALVCRLREANGLDGADLQPGQSLRFPADCLPRPS